MLKNSKTCTINAVNADKPVCSKRLLKGRQREFLVFERKTSKWKTIFHEGLLFILGINIIFLFSPPRSRILHYLYSITVRSAAPQTTLHGETPRAAIQTLDGRSRSRDSDHYSRAPHLPNNNYYK